MGREIAKNYEPQQIEPRWADFWVREQLFRTDPNAPGPVFSIVIPPPNVTGSLRIGRMVFVQLYEQGLIYRAHYMTNWCPVCLTVLSDLEVLHEERQGHLWHIRYPVVGTQEHIVVATTRPETMLGDTAVAVHPEDERYKHLIGRKVMLPLMNREIPIIGDEIVDREFGTGAVKIKPAHDPDDF